MLKRNRFTETQINVLQEAFDIWKKKYKEQRSSEWKINGKEPQIQEFRKVWREICLMMYDKVVEERDGIQLLYYLGDMYIAQLPANTKDREFAKSVHGHKRYWKQYKNYQPLCKLVHSLKRGNSYKNNKYWKFYPCRKFDRYIKKEFLKNPGKYKIT